MSISIPEPQNDENLAQKRNQRDNCSVNKSLFPQFSGEEIAPCIWKVVKEKEDVNPVKNSYLRVFRKIHPHPVRSHEIGNNDGDDKDG